MLRASHWMPSSKNKALLSLLSARFSACLSWSLVPLPVQHRPPYLHHRCCSASGRLRLCSSSSSRHCTRFGWQKEGPFASRCDRPPTLVLANDRKEGRQPQQQRRGFFAAGSARSSSHFLRGLLMAAPAKATAGEGGAGARQREQQEDELVLDREFFSKETTVVAVKLPAKRTSELRTRLKKELMNVPHRKNVERCPGDDSCRLLLLSPAVLDPETLEGLSDEAAAFVKGDEGLSTTTFNVKTDYSMLGVEEVLKRLLEPRLPRRDLPTSFEVAGHLAHLNLRDYLLPYKKLIGQVIIDKNARVTTVVNKIDTISTQFRTFPMEVVAGEPNTEVVVKESGCSFQFDFAKVYWNSRLQTEHARLIKVIGQQQQQQRKPAVVCDMMAGVGPFAIPLAKRGHRVFANDLNPDSYSALRDNGFKNKVGGRLTTSNECGRAFARRLIRERQVFHHAILNLPDSALTFLDTFRGVDWRANGFGAPPTVHVYCFSKAADPKQDALDRANEVMGSSLTQRDVKIHVVRDVAPNKPMLCLSFVAPDAGANLDADAGAGRAETLVQSVGSAAAGGAPPAATTASADGGAAETTCSSSGEAGAGGAGTRDSSIAGAGAASSATAVVGVDVGAGAGGVEGADGGACKKRQRTAAAGPGDEGS